MFRWIVCVVFIVSMIYGGGMIYHNNPTTNNILFHKSTTICTTINYNHGEWRSRINTQQIANCTVHNHTLGCRLTNYGLRMKSKFLSLYRHCNGHRVLFRRSEHELARVMESVRWQWQPNDCVLNAYTPQRMKRLVGDRPLIFVGDSITCDMQHSLVCMQGGGEHALQSSCTRMDGLGIKIKNPNVNELLELPRLVRQEWLKNFPNGVQDRAFLIINTGAHWYAGRPRKTFPVLARVLRSLTNATIVFRTTIMGHKGCEHFVRPLSSLTAEQKRNFSSLYQWRTFDKLNDDALWGLRALKPHFYTLNVSMFERRPDGHMGARDCLHYTVPSAINTWNKLLYHILVHAIANESRVTRHR